MRTVLSAGITLVELVLAIAVLAILAGTAAPPLLDLLDRVRIGGAAEALYADLLLARSEAIRRNAPVAVSLRGDAASRRWCYALSTDERCNCFLPGDCRLQRAPGRGGSGADFKGLRMGHNFRHGILRFFPARGTATAGTVWLATERHRVELKVSALGRVRICSDRLGRYPSC